MAVSIELAKDGMRTFKKCMKALGQSSTEAPRGVHGRRFRCWISKGGEVSGEAPVGMTEGDFILQLSGTLYHVISWNAVATADSYNVYRSVDASTYTLLGNTTNTEYSDTDLAKGLTYSYKCRSVISGVESEDSNVVSNFYAGAGVYIYEGGTTYTRIN